ncbi:MAG: heterodisulfide reductase subunit A-like protein [Armatimonadetes bacterium]|nr:heterodisulfide reductase subunit A-like protein [Armatimonadota bacterium]
MSDNKPKRGVLLCVCQGTCPSFQQMNVFEVLNTLRREKVVDWVGLHPQLCADDGDAYLLQLLRGAEDLDYLYVAGCDPTMQRKMFRYAFEQAGFDPGKHRGVDIRNMTTEQAVDAIKQLIAQESN